MTIHHHGTPITPNNKLIQLGGRHFCVSFYRPDQVRLCHDLGQSVMLDNGAFSYWRRGEPCTDWKPYYEWCEKWLDCPTTWAVVPDVIDGTVEENCRLMDQWPFKTRGVPVYHMDEPIGHLLFMIKQNKWPRIAIGSSGKYSTVGDHRWHQRMDHIFNKIVEPSGRIPVQLHMLRGMAMSRQYYPFYSVDSTDLARNHSHRDTDIRLKADEWDRIQTPIRYTRNMEQRDLM